MPILLNPVFVELEKRRRDGATSSFYFLWICMGYMGYSYDLDVFVGAGAAGLSGDGLDTHADDLLSHLHSGMNATQFGIGGIIDGIADLIDKHLFIMCLWKGHFLVEPILHRTLAKGTHPVCLNGTHSHFVNRQLCHARNAHDLSVELLIIHVQDLRRRIVHLPHDCLGSLYFALCLGFCDRLGLQEVRLDLLDEATDFQDLILQDG